MSQVEELLKSLGEDDVLYTSEEPHFVVNPDRTITIPDELKSIAVQHDNNVETVTFDCPRYWDEHDFSTMNVFINFVRSDGFKDYYEVTDVSVDETDDTMIHFTWTISNNVTAVSGKLSFLICIKNPDLSAHVHWNSRLNEDLIVQPGMEVYSYPTDSSPDIIEDVLSRLEFLEDNVATKTYVHNYVKQAIDTALKPITEEVIEQEVLIEQIKSVIDSKLPE